MRYLWILTIFGFFSAKSQDVFQLAPPLMVFPSVFFEKEATVLLCFAQPGTHIHFTTNGQDPTEKDQVYQRPVVIKKDVVTLKAKVFGSGFLPSEVVAATFYKQGLKIRKIEASVPHKQYQGSGNATLMDGKGGIVGHGSKTWMGFQQDTVVFQVTLAKPQKVKYLLLDVLQNQGAWIFMPQKVEVFYQKKSTAGWASLTTKILDATTKVDDAGCQAIIMDLDKTIKISQIVVKVYPLAHIPDWHPGKGSPSWLFIDEIKLY